MKVCGKCRKPKELTEFNKNRTRRDGLQTTCKKCFKEMNLEGGKRDRRLFKRLGVEPGTYQKLFDLQQGKCQICGIDYSTQRKYRLAVDHCHKTGKVRGLLCITCNLAVGWLENSGEHLNEALAYIERHK